MIGECPEGADEDPSGLPIHCSCVDDVDGYCCYCDCLVTHETPTCETCGQPATYRLGMPTPTWCDAHGPQPVTA